MEQRQLLNIYVVCNFDNFLKTSWRYKLKLLWLILLGEVQSAVRERVPIIEVQNLTGCICIRVYRIWNAKQRSQYDTAIK